MKSDLNVSVSNSSSDSLPHERFLASAWASTPLGKLYIQLLEENTWSKEFNVYASLGGQSPALHISHREFKYSTAATRNFLVYQNSEGTAPSVHDVAKLVLANFKDRRETITSTIGDLQSIKSAVENKECVVLLGLAKAATQTKFPEAQLEEGKTSTRKRLFWFEDKSACELYVLRYEDLMASESPAIYRMPGVTCQDFERRVYIDSIAVEAEFEMKPKPI
ncbi:MAG: hypothetical protein ACAH17_03255 [Candidatus Paceibacterota bacterium]